MNKRLNTHNMKIPFGKHKGELFTRLPLGYLKWMVNQDAQQADIAAAELERRGTPEPTIEVSAHAINRASLRVRRTWHETRGREQGLYSWLAQMAAEALSENGGVEAVKENDSKAWSKGMVFIFELDLKWPVLKTIRRAKQNE